MSDNSPDPNKMFLVTYGVIIEIDHIEQKGRGPLTMEKPGDTV